MPPERTPGLRRMVTYLPDAFRLDDPVAVAALIDAHPFATLVSVVDGAPVVSHLPMLREDDPSGRLVLSGHLARANPHWRALTGPAPTIAIFHGADAYVSPGWYPTKRETGRVVPTWNYEVVHVHGRARAVPEGDWLARHIARLSDRHEQASARPWSVTDAPADFTAALVRGIVGVELVADEVTAKVKASQNRSETDRAGVVAGLLARGRADDRALAARVAATLAAGHAGPAEGGAR